MRRGTHASASKRIPNRTTALATMCPALESPRYGSRRAARFPRNTTAMQARWAQNKRLLNQIVSRSAFSAEEPRPSKIAKATIPEGASGPNSDPTWGMLASSAQSKVKTAARR
jgi:hypothetical protein